MRFVAGLLSIILLCFSPSLTYGACCSFMFGECCGRQPCSCITWRGDCCLPTYQLYADFLYWQVHPEGLEFAKDGGDSFSSAVSVEETGKVLSPGCRAKPGFRIGLTVDLPCCTWDVFGKYSYISNNLLKSKRAAQGETGLRPLIWNNGSPGDQDINYAEGKYRFDVNVLDFGLGHSFPVGRCFNFRPHLGLKATWQKLRYRVTYQRIVNQTTISEDQICFVTDFNGLGVRGGFDAEWGLCRCISLVGGLAQSAVYSDINRYRRDDHTANILSANPVSVNNVWVKEEHCLLVPVTELIAGIQFTTTICEGYRATLLIAWEAQKWWNLNQFIYFGSSTANNNVEFGPRGGITYQGLTTRLTLDF